MAKDNIKEEDRYWQKMSCEICKKCIGWAPYMRSEYQCIDCNKLGADWEIDKTYTIAYGGCELVEDLPSLDEDE